MNSIGSGPLARIVKSAGARAFVLPLSGGAALLITRLITSEYGPEAYAVFSLAAALPFLIPMMDLGIGSAVTNAAAGLPGHPGSFNSVLRKAQRILMSVGASLGAASLALGAFGLWTTVLNLESSRELNWSIATAVLLVAVSVPLSLGARILLGIRRNAFVVLVQGATSVVNLAAVTILFVARAEPAVLIAVSTVGVLVTNFLLNWVALRSPAIRAARAYNKSSERDQNTAIWSTAVPMVVVSIALPFTFQSDRIVLGWTSSLEQVAIYSGAAMVFLPVLSIVQVAGRSLWGDFAEARHSGRDVSRLFNQAVLLSTFLGIGGALGLVIFGPVIARWATSGIVDIPHSLYFAFAGVVICQAIQQPAGMYLTDVSGLRFQAVTTVVTAIASLVLSIYFASKHGAIGPVLATVVVLAFLHVVPCLLYSYRRIRNEGVRRCQLAAMSASDGSVG
ncbi:lipopolysaccharide biosynthesis protein [Rhodococcus aetherivorans]